MRSVVLVSGRKVMALVLAALLLAAGAMSWPNAMARAATPPPASAASHECAPCPDDPGRMAHHGMPSAVCPLHWPSLAATPAGLTAPAPAGPVVFGPPASTRAEGISLAAETPPPRLAPSV